jgi:hypothetical protein
MARRDDKITINGVIMGQTAKAIRFHSDFMDLEVWLPKSQITITIEEGAESEAGIRASVQIPVWLADKNGIE